MNARDKRLERAQLKVFYNVPFFAPGVAKLPVVWDSSVRTAGTAGQVIRWNPDWFDSLKDSELVTVLCHEVCHPMLGHLWRFEGKEHDLANQAADHAVNLMLKEFSAQVMARNLADPFPFPQPANAYCADPQFAGMSEEQIYGILASRQKPPGGSPQPQSKPQPQSAAGGSQHSTPTPKNASGGNCATNGQPNPHSMPEFGQFAVSKGINKAAQNALQTDWEQTFIQSVKAAQGRGDVPGSLLRVLDGILHPQVDWVSLLRAFLREQCADDYDYLKPNLLFDPSGFIVPSLNSERMGPVVFGSDYSGSTQGELVERFHSEKQAALDDLRPAKLVDIGFDTRIVSEKEYVPGETIVKEVRGGGGTDFRPLLARCSELHPKCAVILTDLDGALPEIEPDFPILWVVWDKSAKAPWGEVIYAETQGGG